MDAICIDPLTPLAGSGPVIGLETDDVDITVLAWPEGSGVAAHVNSEVDVVTTVLAGAGEATLAGVVHALKPGSVLVIPKGVERSIVSRSADFRYINVHKRRRRLMPNMKRP